MFVVLILFSENINNLMHKQKSLICPYVIGQSSLECNKTDSLDHLLHEVP